MASSGFAEAQARALAAYGVEAESRAVPVQSLDGPAQVLVAGSGPPLLLVIGAGVPAALWAPLVAQLPTHTVHAVDLPGQGGTARLPEADTRGLRQTMTTFLGEVLTGLGVDACAVVGQSFGGTSALWLALDHAERVRSLSLVACPATLLGTSAPVPMRLLSVPAVARAINAVQPPSPRQVDQVGRLVGEDFGQHPALRELMVHFEQLPHAAADFSRLLHRLITLRGPRREVEVTEAHLAALTVPTQLIWGDRDPFGPVATGRRAASLVPGGRFHEVPGGHAPWLDDAAAVATLVADFAAA